MLPFITGSQSYGQPTDKSDIDLVMLVDEETAQFLRSKAEKHFEEADKYPDCQGSVPLRFGKLNLIVCTDPLAYSVWLKAKEVLDKHYPVSREDAVKYHKKLRKHHKVHDLTPNPDMEIPL